MMRPQTGKISPGERARSRMGQQVFQAKSGTCSSGRPETVRPRSSDSSRRRWA